VFLVEALELIGYKRHLAKYGDTYADWDPASRSDAQQILASITSFEFIVVFLTVYQFMSHLAGITYKLQRIALDIVDAYEMITEITKLYQVERKNVDSSFAPVYDQSIRMAEKMELLLGCPVSQEGNSTAVMLKLALLVSISREMLLYPSLTTSSCALISSFHHQPLLPLHSLDLSPVFCVQKKSTLRQP